MSNYVKKGNHPIDAETRELISYRYKRITKAVNQEFWNSNSETSNSRYVGSYGRGTAIDTSDLDIMMVLPNGEYDHFTNMNSNGASRLLQAVKSAIINTYPNTTIKADGQVVVALFSDGMKFEILPAFKHINWFGDWDNTYLYPDANMGGNWLSTDPLSEQKEMKDKNKQSSGLFFDTCKHLRFIHSNYYSSYHLSGILIDSFVYYAIRFWKWYEPKDDNTAEPGEYETHLLNVYSNEYCYVPGLLTPSLKAPGSEMSLDTTDWDILGKVLKKVVY